MNVLSGPYQVDRAVWLLPDTPFRMLFQGLLGPTALSWGAIDVVNRDDRERQEVPRRGALVRSNHAPEPQLLPWEVLQERQGMHEESGEIGEWEADVYCRGSYCRHLQDKRAWATHGQARL